LNNALLSRVRVYILKGLEHTDVIAIARAALTDSERGLGGRNIAATEEVLGKLAQAADGDARRMLVLLELASDVAVADNDGIVQLTESAVAEVTRDSLRHFDKSCTNRSEAVTRMQPCTGFAG